MLGALEVFFLLREVRWAEIGVKSSAVNHNATGGHQAEAHRGGIVATLREGWY